MLAVGIAFTSLQFAYYFLQKPMSHLRPFSLLTDIVLVGAIIATFQGSGINLFEIYYIVVITGAIWYRRSGAVITALTAIAVSFSMEFATNGHDPALAAGILIAHAPLLLIVAITTGYLVRGRDAERARNVEINHELRMARTLQDRMIPDSIPQVPGFDIAHSFLPARLVGGDLYNISMTDEHHMLVVVADMAGKSVYGLVHLSAVYSHLLAAVHDGLSPVAIAERINSGVYLALQPDSYAAMFIGSIDTRTGEMEYVNCGHVPPLLLNNCADPEPIELCSGGILIGAVPDPNYRTAKIALEPDSVLVLFTDGITEVRDAKRVQFGEQRIVDAVRLTSGKCARDCADAIIAARESHAVDQHADDATLIVLKRTATTNT